MTQEMLADHYHLVAPTAPHDCDMPGCPGPLNKRKLEAFDNLLAALQGWLAVVDEQGQGNCCGCHYEQETMRARAAVAKATGEET